ncbi:hypothetical protein HPB52_009720 [Rhipicephalus sanguineus]|uniref:Uncharacterized protein n=1 Tax=Rhipicephalus sanguineus TaxID=34632 RepID=A0A9D4SPJ1_RHISA|nr:hypothetical protein HPB52_009720 [Rhipicephalus sanguineus]
MSGTAGYDEPCINQWKSQLHMARPCGVSSSEETCCLWDDLRAWNREMSALGLELEQSSLGTLLLRCSFDEEADSERVATCRQASFHASWLLRHHSCIQEVILCCPKSANLVCRKSANLGRTTTPGRPLPSIVDRDISQAPWPVHQGNLLCSFRPERPGRRHWPGDAIHQRT